VTKTKISQNMVTLLCF